MSKSKYRAASEAPEPGRPRWLIPAIVAGLIVLVAGALALIFGGRGPAYEPEVAGAPRAQIEQTSMDLGDVALNEQVESTFRLRNIGDEALVVLGEPRVELVEGC